MTGPEERLRIGELSRRVGLTEHVLRAWERRYEVLRPERTAGGFRLYTPADVARVRRMQAALSRGLSAAEAARVAVGPADDPDQAATTDPDDLASALADSRSALTAALDSFDGPGAHAALEDLVATHGVEAALRDGVLPYLHTLGERWHRGEADVAQEHFASHLLRGALLALVRPPEDDSRTALLGCPPGEQHDLPLLVLAVSLSRRGWRTVLLGADVPMPDLTTTAHRLHPELVVLGSTSPALFAEVTAPLRALARATVVALGGAGATPETAEAAGALLLTEDPVTAAARLSDLDTSSPPGTRPGTTSPTRHSDSEGRP